MLAICLGNRFSVVLGLVIQYLSGGGHIFRPGFFTISYSNAGGVFVGGRLGRPAVVVSAAPPPTGLMRTYHTPGGYQPHAKDLLSYFVSFTKVGVFISFSGCLGVGGPLSVSTCFRFRHVNQAGLRLFWGFHSGRAGVRL